MLPAGLDILGRSKGENRIAEWLRDRFGASAFARESTDARRSPRHHAGCRKCLGDHLELGTVGNTIPSGQEGQQSVSCSSSSHTEQIE